MNGCRWIDSDFFERGDRRFERGEIDFFFFFSFVFGWRFVLMNFGTWRGNRRLWSYKWYSRKGGSDSF